MEGSLAAAYGELDRPDRQASWTISNPKTGKPKQHYPLESVTWANGSPEANRRYVSIENEGRAGEPLTGNQVANLVAILDEIATHCPQVLPYERSTSVKEHNEMTAFGASPTACPSGRIPWVGIIAALQEDDMPLNDQDKAWIAKTFGDLLVSTLRSDEFSLNGVNFRVGKGVKLDDVIKAIQGIPGATIDATVAEIAKATADEFAKRQQD